MIVQFLLTLFLNQIDPSALYTIMEKDQQMILKTYHRITPERVIVHYTGREEVIENKKKESTFYFKGDLESVEPIFSVKTQEDLLKLIEKHPLEQWPEKIVNVLDTRQLLMLYKNDRMSEINPLKFLKKRTLTLNDLKGFQFSLKQRMALVNILNTTGVTQLKQEPYYLLPLIYSEHQNIFSKRDQRYLLGILRTALKQHNSAVIKGVFSLNVTPFYFFKGILFTPDISKEDKIFLLEAINLSDNPIEDQARFYPKYIQYLKKFDTKTLKKVAYHLPLMIQQFSKHIQGIVDALPRYLQLPFLEGVISQVQVRLPSGMINYLLREQWEGYLWILLKYVQGREINHRVIRRRVTQYLEDDEGPFYLKILYQCFFYANHQKIFDHIMMKTPVLIALYEYLIARGLRYKTAISYAYKKGFDTYEPAALRLLMGQYIILKDKRFSSQPFFNYIRKIHNHKKLEFQEDEFYIQTILPMLAHRYHPHDFEEYIILMETKNRVMIRALLQSIAVIKKKRFIKPLEKLKGEIRDDPMIYRQVERVITLLRQH